MKQVINEKRMPRHDIEQEVARLTDELHIPPELHIDYVLNACFRDPELAPDFRKRKGFEKLSDQDCIRKWVTQFHDSYENRYERCKLKETKTVPDPALGILLSNANAKLFKKKNLDTLIEAHRFAMTAENIIGNVLELFLFEKLNEQGWGFAWGNTVLHVDMCSENVLLQIKNRDNSENSSSKTVRDNHDIKFWYRSNSKKDETNWPALYDIIGRENPAVSCLTEENFQEFLIRLQKEFERAKKKSNKK